MIHHFQVNGNVIKPGWNFTFFYQQQKYSGYYYPDGTIEWFFHSPDPIDIPILEKHIHDLMIYHIYD